MHPQNPAACALLAAFALAASAAAQVRFLGSTLIPPDARDMSGLKDELPGGTPHDRLGSMGSAIAYSGKGERYLMLADRGPNNGLDPYRCRWHEFDIHVAPGEAEPVRCTLVSTTLMSGPDGPYLGLSTLWSTDPLRQRRLDPEGIRVLPDGDVLISDEYGPIVALFERATGRRKHVFPMPKGFAVSKPSGDGALETTQNAEGRVSNHGFEGLALSPDGRRAFALLQAPLIQDGGRDGVNLRMLEIDLATDALRQVVVPLDKPKLVTCEVLAIDDHRFLMIERDGKAGPESACKRIVEIDIAGATDVSDRATLPAGALPPEIKPAARKVVLDMLSPGSGIDRASLPEKVEGLAFGPPLPSGERLLLITSDNDFRADQPTFVWAFALGESVFTTP